MFKEFCENDEWITTRSHNFEFCIKLQPAPCENREASSRLRLRLR